ncbi:MAG: hypothetical protein KC431_30085, partial [Myxococcales bacterium]|nr:hypothetical protein [Myxococcales bacterium]
MDPAARAEADQLREPSGPTLTGTVDVSSTLVNIGRAYDVRTGTRSLARVTVQDHDEGPPELTLSDST